MLQPALIADRFELLAQAGSGGMGEVYRTRDRATGELVAIKLLHRDHALDAERFNREATLLAELGHPGIVRHVDHGTTDDGRPWLAMEWLDGEDLAARLARQGLTVAETLTVVAGAARALGAAHRQGVVHRDVKPSNLFLVGGGLDRIKIIDFGVARRGDRDTALTRTGAVIGTPQYMAPEQARGQRRLDPRADVFALGCVLYECLTGAPPFRGEHLMAVLVKILLENPTPLAELRPGLPAPLTTLVDRMLAKDPADRLADADAVLRALDDLGVVDGGAVPVPSRALPALTASEQRIVCVIVVGTSERLAYDGATLAADDEPGHCALLRDLAASFGGRMDALGDGTLIVSMQAVAGTDQAARAARCALALRAACPDVPMVLATGRGLVGQDLPVGEVVDRAIRMLDAMYDGSPRADAEVRVPHLGPRCSVRVDDSSASLLAARFAVPRIADEAWLCGEIDGVEASRTVNGRATACVGRERELALLEGLVDEACDDQVARAALVLAPPGTGKSRLAHELLQRLEGRFADAALLVGRGDPLAPGSRFGLLGPALRRLAGVVDGEPHELRLARLRARLGRWLPPDGAPRTLDFLAEIAGLPTAHDDDPALRAARLDPQLMADAMAEAWRTWLDAETAAHPVILVLEDLHWGDLPTVQFVDRALRDCAERPLFVLALARPEVRDAFPRLWAERGVQEVQLTPLTRRAAERLVRDVLGAETPAHVVAEIVERAEGNPFFLEELLRAWAAGSTGDRRLPESVLGMIQARLDGLGADARRALRAASVFGRSFRVGGVAALLGGLEQTTRLQDALDDLVAREVLVRKGVSSREAAPVAPAADTEYTFRHALMGDAAYAMLTEADRLLGHRLAGAWLEAAGEPDPLVLALHAERGGEPAKAVTALARAAARALQAHDFAAVLGCVARALAAGAAGDELAELHVLRAAACAWSGDQVTARASALLAVDLSRPGTLRWFQAVTELVRAAGKLGDFDLAAAWLHGLVAAEPEPGATSAHVVALSACRAALVHGGRLHHVAPSRRRLDELEATGELSPAATACIHSSRVFDAVFVAVDVPAGLRHGEAELEAHEAAGNQREAATAMANLGHMYGEANDPGRAEGLLRRSAAIAERMHLPYVLHLAQLNLAGVLARTDRLVEARDLVTAALEAFRAQGNQRLQCASHVALAQLELVEGRPFEAEAQARLALAVATSVFNDVDVQTVLGRALLAQGRVADALAALDLAVAPLDRTPALGLIKGGTRVARAEALRAAGDAIAARREVEAGLASSRASLERAPAEWRTRIQHRPDHRRLLELAGQLGVRVDAGLAGLAQASEPPRRSAS